MHTHSPQPQSLLLILRTTDVPLVRGDCSLPSTVNIQCGPSTVQTHSSVLLSLVRLLAQMRQGCSALSVHATPTLGVHILPVCPGHSHSLALLQRAEVEEVRRTVHLVVELLGIGQRQLILLVGVVSDTCNRRHSTRVQTASSPTHACTTSSY